MVGDRLVLSLVRWSICKFVESQMDGGRVGLSNGKGTMVDLVCCKFVRASRRPDAGYGKEIRGIRNGSFLVWKILRFFLRFDSGGQCSSYLMAVNQAASGGHYATLSIVRLTNPANIGRPLKCIRKYSKVFESPHSNHS